MRYLKVLVIFELLVSTAAFATVSPCSKDRLKFCNVKAAPEDLRACLLQHKDELSDVCKARRRGGYALTQAVPRSPALGSSVSHDA